MAHQIFCYGVLWVEEQDVSFPLGVLNKGLRGAHREGHSHIAPGFPHVSCLLLGFPAPVIGWGGVRWVYC